jgi:hypothetical protein
LAGRETAFGPIPKTLRPIFRDRDDFSAGASLTEQTRDALAGSQFLVVICSPNAARSEYVNQEVLSFKRMGGVERILAVIIDGEPGDPNRECFPPALRYRLGEDGQLSATLAEPVAADCRPQGDGKEVALRKLVAGLLGVGLDEIKRRAERARKRRNRIRLTMAAFAAVLVLGAVGGWTIAVNVSKRLNSAELLNIERDAVEICESTEAKAKIDKIPDARLLAFALHCLQTYAEGLEVLPDDVEVPKHVIRAVEHDLAIVHELSKRETLSEAQQDTVRRATALLARLQSR